MPSAGFEDREDHRTPCASVSRLPNQFPLPSKEEKGTGATKCLSNDDFPSTSMAAHPMDRRC
jgi:hypothetical protein